MKNTVRDRVLYHPRSVSLYLTLLYSGLQFRSVRDQLGAPGIGPGIPPLPREALVDVHVNVSEWRQDEPTSCVDLFISTRCQMALNGGNLSVLNPYVQRFPRLSGPGITNDKLHHSHES